MQVICQVSLGELVDKLTILEIKAKKVQDQVKAQEIGIEMEVLSKTLADLQLKDIDLFMDPLREVNLTLWGIEDDIRLKEQKGEFDQSFIDLARSVYQQNDLRFQCKDRINRHFGSTVKEVKLY
ncbi:MAG: hypothetical protein HN353_13725 [Bdellovibrionales bacterium]|jgi:hypothetical protein|nr:hypothetical protein [Bdellovibrionales bacterium]MBT3524847.1 hypothetical protein [Bdellovibrionales bacterium]MBT7668977.1 hypothetical protein [Bdellovibrionales bacterium]MBT7767210.1 hypothetical protein [Bdellovibrionales bacterium]